ncbi:MAG: ribokinase [Microbacteriaceae bacterium]
MSTPSVVVVGSMNADDSIRVRTLPAPGETITALSVSTALGGKGANQAVAAARGGASVRFVGAAGAADGEAVVAAIAAEGIDVEHVQRLQGVPTGRAIVMIDDAAENSIVVLAGANRGFSPGSVAEALAGIAAGELLLLQDEVPAEVNRAAAAAARAAGATVIWNAAPAPTSADELVHDVDLLVVNEHELEAVAALLEVPVDGIDATLAAVASAIGGDAVCTLGAEGAAYAVDGETGRAPARRVEAVDTTAAGDTFVGYLAATAGGSFAERLRTALGAGSLTVTKLGSAGSIPLRAEVEAWLADA